MAARKRTLVSLAAGVLVAPLLALPASPAFAAGEDTPPPPRSVADFCQNVPDDEPFTDIEGNTFEDNIVCLAASGITRGQSGGNTYGPGAPVNRDAMASFVARLIDTAGELDTGENIRSLPAFDGEVTPTDVAESSVHAENIDRLFEAGVVAGGPGGRPATQYGPELPVSRAQMASFIRNALQFMSGEDITTDQDFFTDDETSEPHEPRINAVAALAIAVGDGRDTYQPARTVSRDQMSGFLTRTLAALEASGAITPLGAGSGGLTTDAPDLVSAELAERGTATEGTTNVVFTFDEEVADDAVDEGAFLVYAFDGEQFVADSATRETGGSSVRASFTIDDDRAEDLTVATVDAAAVEDADGNLNPIGDAPVGEGVEATGGRTSAPDVLNVENIRASSSTTAVDFVFDQDTFVVDPTAGQFQLVNSDGTSIDGTPSENDEGAFAGDGSDTITVEFEGRMAATQTVRGVVLQGTVSSEEQVANGLPIPGLPVGGDTPEGDVNPLQATDMDNGGTTAVPDLVTADVDVENNEVTYAFDENVALEDAALFSVYDDSGAQVAGTEGATSDRDGDRLVVITFGAGELDTVVGASVDEGAVTQSNSGARENQEDEVSVGNAAFAAGETVGPDLTGVTRESSTEGVTLRFTFDDEAGDAVAASFFVVSETGEQTALGNCAQSETTGEEAVVECVVSAEDDPLTPTVDEAETFTAAEEAVAATVDDGAVTDAEGDTNPEGAEPLEAA